MFDGILQRKDGFSRTSLISSLSQHRCSSEQALFLASRMRSSGFKLNSYSLVCLIRALSNLGWISYAQQLHSYILKSGFHSNVFVATALLGVYVKWGFLDHAHCLFGEIPQPNVVSWNSLIYGYAQSGECLKALGLVSELARSSLRPDVFTFTAALTACTQPSFLDLARSVHCKIIKFGFESSIIAGNCLIDMYGKCGSVCDAILEFHLMKDKDIVSWNSIIGANAQNQRVADALDLFHQMPVPDTISYNEVISCLAQVGNMEDALKILSEMPNPNSSSWNSVIAGYVKQNRVQEALDFFSKMHSAGITKDQFTFSSIIRGAACLSALNWGALIHCCTIKSGWDSCIVVGSALIDMYSKCGQIKKAEMVFGSLTGRNLVTWNAMISGYAHNGNTREALWMFKEMKTMRGLKPDHITFVGVLSACGHDGLLGDGIRYFESMTREYGIRPTAEHCSCMIHLLGQGGELLRAQRMIYELGFESCGLVWKALLTACRACGDVEVAEVAAVKVLALEGDDEFVYVLMSNTYASHGRWNDVSDVRELMRERGMRKEAGCSWIEVENALPISSIKE
ncbi:putative pentatricopeptide repeat-containing protein At5g47460 [Magnolia sinica]|uniref:putative pentatricopeptide repeat-containing protein At5g47460 n=1 Tax=Magnolia sinica TaxID=86752 RepID=UPI0026581F3B|nr:putative pentatricopeptide repeat-containing protein At5g47460 [Magnolia sinica]